MHAVDVRRLAALDLNLLIALHALLATRSVTGAARMLGRTQSTTSHALARIREALGDDVLSKSGRGLVPTPRALELEPHVRAAIDALARVFEPVDAAFDPLTSTRSFTLACPDLLGPAIPAMLARIAAQAPGLRLQIELPGASTGTALASGAVDLVLGAAADPSPDLRVRSLGSLHFAVAARNGHPGVHRGRLTRANWVRWPHVLVRTGNSGPNVLQGLLDAHGIERTTGFVAPSFILALQIVAQTDQFFTAPMELLALLADSLGFQIAPVPVPLPPLPVAMWWHARSQRDPAHIWLRGQIRSELESRL